MSKVAGMKDCVEALATKRGVSKVEAQSIMQDVVEVIAEKCVEGGVAFKDMFSIKQKTVKGRSGSINGYDWETADKISLKISVGGKLEQMLNK